MPTIFIVVPVMVGTALARLCPPYEPPYETAGKADVMRWPPQIAFDAAMVPDMVFAGADAALASGLERYTAA